MEPPFRRPENAQPKEALQSFHCDFKNRYYYMAFPLMTTALFPLILKATKLIIKQLSEDNTAAAAFPLILLILNMCAVDKAISLFSFGTENRFDPVNTLSVFDPVRNALIVLRRQSSSIYENNIYKMIAETPEYINPNLKIETGILAIDHKSSYTPLKLAKELGAHNITEMFDRVADEEKIIFLLLRSFVNKDGDLTQLNMDVFVHILSFLAGSKISELKDKAPHTELQAVTVFAVTHAKRQRDNLPKFLAYFESKMVQSKPTNDSALSTPAFRI